MGRSYRLIVAVLLCLTAMMGTWNSQAQDDDGLIIAGAWVRPTALSGPAMEVTEEPMGHAMVGGVSAAYLTIENRANRVYRLIAASTTGADIVEVHQTSMVDDVMQMRPVIDGIEIPDGERVSLEPGGYHIMLMDLAQELVPGDGIMLTLLFDMPYEDGLAPGATHAVVVGVPILEQAPEPSDIIVDNAWARPTVLEAVTPPEPETTPEAGTHHEGMRPGSDVSAVYMTLINNGDTDQRLVGAHTDVARITEIHETTMENDVMRMRPVDGVDLPADASVQLEPGGHHVMLLDLQQPLIPGAAVMVTLVFESGDKLIVAVPVYDAQAPENRGEGND